MITSQSQSSKKVLIIGGGLAGSEAALFLAKKGIPVVLAECKRIKPNPAQKISDLAELVCTNSLKSIQVETGHGLLKLEMKALDSVVLEVGLQTAVPAGDALAVDRHLFSKEITRRLSSHPLIEIYDEEIQNPREALQRFDCEYAVVATGPLTTNGLEEWIQKEISQDDLYFYDAIAPVVDADTLDYSKLYFKDRHKEEEESADYLNIPLTQEQYYQFVEELVNAEKVAPKDFEEYTYFEQCLPIDVMAERGKDTPRFSCMKPIGLALPDGSFPYAVVQLRKENLLGDAFNLVGFQTRLTYKEQVRVFRMLPGLENASFIHLGSVHRNTFLNAHKLLNFDLSCKAWPNLHFAGQMTGVEGYTESAMMGLYVGFQIWRKINGEKPLPWPVETATGALINYLMTAEKPVPSNINFGLFPPITLSPKERKGKNRKKLKKSLVSQRAQEALKQFLHSQLPVPAESTQVSAN